MSGTGGARRAPAVALGLCVLGAGLALFAASRGWVHLDVDREDLPDRSVTASGRRVEPAVAALAVVGLAGVVGLLATRRRARQVLALVLTLAGLAVVVLSVPHLWPPSPARALDLVESEGALVGVAPDSPVRAEVRPWWPLLAAVGGLALCAGAGLAALRGHRWPAMSGRYDPPRATIPTRAGEPSRQMLWDAQDRGDDLTVRTDSSGGGRRP